MSSAYRIPMDSWRPATASVPVASMGWMGLKRLPHRPLCGPLLSKLSASENTFPLRMRRAAWMMSCGEILFSVPASSSAPQRPQFFKRSAAAWISWSVTLSFGFVMSLDPLWDSYNHSHKLIDYHGRKFQTFAFIHPRFERFGLSWRRRLAGDFLLPTRFKNAGGTPAPPNHRC